MVYLKQITLLSLILILLSGAAADAYGDTATEPVPNVTDIRIYDVENENTVDGNKTGGTLEDSGLNTTFSIAQQEQRDYRFEFKIINEGTQWNIDDGDNMIHEGLNSSWDAVDIWYNISGSGEFNGNSATFSGDKITWDTSTGGTLDNGQTMYAKYIVSIDQGDTSTFSEHFEVNETTLTDSGSFDDHELTVEKLGYMHLNLTEPPNDSIVVQNQSFLMNGSVECVDGKCGTVTVNARYNESSTADTNIPDSTTAEPFNTNISSRTCSLGRGEKCYTNFSVNASGSYESYHLLDYEASSSRDIENNNSEDHLVQINSALVIDLKWTTIDFGSLDPGMKDKPAENNSDHLYNVTVDERSGKVDDLWIRATDLNSSKLDYNISAKNLSVATTNDISNEMFLSNTYQHLSSALSPGDILTTFYWIDVPFGIYKGEYEGTVFFKANSTG